MKKGNYGHRDRADDRLGSFSGGMKQRILIAASLLGDSDLLIFGMERMLLPLAKGRSSLIRFKLISIALTVLGIYLVFQLSTAVTARFLYGPLAEHAPLQSIPSCGLSSLRLTIGQYLVLHHLLSAGALVFLSFISAWAAIRLRNIVLVFLAPIFLLVLSYGAYLLPIEPRSLLSPVRFLNPYTLYQVENAYLRLTVQSKYTKLPSLTVARDATARKA